MPTRCRNFNDDGTVRQPCPSGSSCFWVHPQDPRWKYAFPYERRDSSRDYGARTTWGTQTGRGGHSGSSRNGPGSWTSQNSSTTTEAPDHDWGSSSKKSNSILLSEKPSWGSSKVDQQALPHTASGSGEYGWGSSSSCAANGKRDVTADPRASDAGTSWGGKGEDAASKGTSGWNTPPKALPHIASGSGESGWGSSSSRAANGKRNVTADPWASDAGTSWGGKGEDAKETSGWGTPPTTATEHSEGWGSSPSSVIGWTVGGGGWGVGTEGSRAADKATSTSGWGANDKHDKQNGWNTGVSDWDTRPTARVPPSRPVQPAPRAKERSRTPINRPATPVISLNKIPLPGRKSSVAQPIEEKGRIISDSLTIKTKGLEPPDPVLSSIPNSARPRETPLTRTQIGSNTIRYTLQAVRLQLELDDAQEDVERLKRLRASQQFSRATPATQNIFGERRLAYGQTAKELKSQLQSTIKYLSELPEVTSRVDLASAQASEQELDEYTAQLRNWLGSLPVQTHATHSPPPPLPEQLDRPKHPKELIWDQMEALVRSVHDTIDIIDEVLYVKREKPVDVVNAKLTLLHEAHEARQLAQAHTDAESMLKEAKQISDDFGVLASETIDVKTAIRKNGQTLASLKAELTQREALNSAFADRLISLEQWKKQDDISIRQLTERVKALYLTPRPTKPAISPDDLLPRIEKVMLDDIQKTVTSIGENLRKACLNNRDLTIAEIFKQLEPILEETYEVCRKANALTPQLPVV